MDKVVGFVHINKNATTCKGAKNPNEFINKIRLGIRNDSCKFCKKKTIK